MDDAKKKYLAYLSLNLALFLLCLYFSKPVWILFLVLSIYYLVRLVKKPVIEVLTMPVNVEHGVLGNYHVDGSDEEALYGLYVKIRDDLVFVDIKEDGLQEQRIQYAKRLDVSQAELEASLDRFLIRNRAFTNKKVGTIGLHSADPEQGEVFWEPEGYTVLRGIEFMDP